MTDRKQLEKLIQFLRQHRHGGQLFAVHCPDEGDVDFVGFGRPADLIAIAASLLQTAQHMIVEADHPCPGCHRNLALLEELRTAFERHAASVRHEAEHLH